MPPGTKEAAPGVPAPHQPNQPDRLFAREAAIGGLAEVELGKLAEQKGQSDAVKAFARRMVGDHGKANERLTALAKQDGIGLPTGLDQEHAAMRDKLEGMSGAEFDRAYIQGQVTDHQKTAQLLEYEIGSGQDRELKGLRVRDAADRAGAPADGAGGRGAAFRQGRADERLARLTRPLIPPRPPAVAEHDREMIGPAPS